jgi:hypothetical protein
VRLRAVLLLSCLASCWRARTGAPDGEQRVYVTPVRIGVGAPHVWFPSELEPVQDAVADVLSRQGFDVIPNSRVRGIVWDAQNGVVPGVYGCRAVPPPAELVANLFPDALQVEPRIECERGACTLEVTLTRDARYYGKPEEVDRFVLAIPGTPATIADEIHRRGLPRVKRPPDDGTGGFGIGNIAEAEPGPYVHVDVARRRDRGSSTAPRSSRMPRRSTGVASRAASIATGGCSITCSRSGSTDTSRGASTSTSIGSRRRASRAAAMC